MACCCVFILYLEAAPVIGSGFGFSYMIFSSPFFHLKFISCLHPQDPVHAHCAQGSGVLVSVLATCVHVSLLGIKAPGIKMTGSPWVVSEIAVTGYHALTGSSVWHLF